MTVLLQVSDAHFGTEDREVREALWQLARDAAPDIAVWTGDLTQRARRAQFEAARQFMASLPVGLNLALPGNHDIPLFHLGHRLFTPYRRYMQAFGTELAPEFDRDDLLLLTVKTTRRWRHSRGQLSAAQALNVAERLRSARAGQLRVVATHQPLHLAPAQDPRHRIVARDDTLAAWARAGLDLLLNGHTHRPACYPVRIADRDVWIVQAGTSMSTRVRAGEPNSVNLIRHHAGQPTGRCDIERWDFQADHRRFACVGHWQVDVPHEPS